MRKILTGAAAALTCAASLGATATSAQADPWHGGWHHEGNGWGYVGAGLAGLAIGAAIAGDHPYYHHYGYGYGPYYGYGYGYGYGTCVGYRHVWDPYWGGYVTRRVYYPC